MDKKILNAALITAAILSVLFIVIMFGFPLESTQVTRTIGQGYKAVQGVFLIFIEGSASEDCVLMILKLQQIS